MPLVFAGVLLQAFSLLGHFLGHGIGLGDRQLSLACLVFFHR